MPIPPSEIPLLEQPSLQPEIDTLRRHMAWIQDAFDRARSFDHRLQLFSAWCHASAHLARLLRVQRLLQSAHPDPLAQFMASVIKEVNDEWDAIASGKPPSTAEELIVAAGDAARRVSDLENSEFPSYRSPKNE